VKTRIDASWNTCKIDNENRLEEQFISSQAFHRTLGGRVREITARVHLRLRKLELFDPVAQDQHRLTPETQN
jgi:hypothetical protein